DGQVDDVVPEDVRQDARLRQLEEQRGQRRQGDARVDEMAFLFHGVWPFGRSVWRGSARHGPVLLPSPLGGEGLGVRGSWPLAQCVPPHPRGERGEYRYLGNQDPPPERTKNRPKGRKSP